MGVDGKIFAQDDKFWNEYLKGRPQPPEAFFSRIFDYHASRGGIFGTAHDTGAGNGPYSQKLRSRFAHVIVSDIVADNVALARARLGDGDDDKDAGFSYRAARLEDVDDIPPGSVDLVFATNVMHFPTDQAAAVRAVATQLRAGGTFACGTFGPARFDDARLQALWERISHQGGRVLLARADRPDETLRVMARTQGRSNMAPLDPALFAPGALRLHLNFAGGDGVVPLLPPEEAYRVRDEPDYVGPDDVEVYTDEDGWSFETDREGVMLHIRSFPFVMQDPAAFAELFRELDDLFEKEGLGLVRGHWPANIILATRL